MSAPNLTISVEPLEDGKAMYLPLAASAADQDPEVKIVLRLRIKNNESTVVTVNAIQFSFPGSSAPATDMQGVALILDPDGSTTPAQAMGTIQPGQTATWSNGVVDLDPDPKVTDNVWNVVFVPAPAPPQITVSVSCNGYASPANATLELAPCTSPTPNGAFLLPYQAADLDEGEYVVTSAYHWANGGAPGGQIFAHDISIRRYDAQINSWSQLENGGSLMNNEDYRIWNMPVRAMADGIVEEWKDDMPTNTITVDANGNLQFPNPTPSPGTGNHFWIRHGDVLVLYAHLQKSLPSALKVKGAKVAAGDQLGLAGNTGNSTNPHTHIQCMRDSISGPLRAMPFYNGCVLDLTRFASSNAADLWVALKEEGIPRQAVAIWPAFCLPRRPFYEAAIDPLALILRGDIYIRLTLPDPPPELKTQIQAFVRTMTPEQRRRALGRLKNLEAYSNAMEDALRKQPEL
jgi:murein DD-endopeptidase MepM/ murein hydrolase activator NlpD